MILLGIVFRFGGMGVVVFVTQNKLRLVDFHSSFSRVSRSLVEQRPQCKPNCCELNTSQQTRQPTKIQQLLNSNEGKSNYLCAYTDRWVPVALLLLLESNLTLHWISWDVHFSGFPKMGHRP